MFKKVCFVLLSLTSLVAFMYSGTMLTLEYFELTANQGVENIKLALIAFMLSVFANLLR